MQKRTRDKLALVNFLEMLIFYIRCRMLAEIVGKQLIPAEKPKISSINAFFSYSYIYFYHDTKLIFFPRLFFIINSIFL